MKKYITARSMRYKKEEVWFPLSEAILSWDFDFHKLMLNDKLRMVSYKKAIKEVVKPGMTVVDIGTGTGILALWALEAGAKKVYGIEINKTRIHDAQRRITKAGYSDKFQVFNDFSYNVTLPEKVDVILSEILGNLADNEDMTPILADARKRFLKKAGTILPEYIETYLVPINSLLVHEQVTNRIAKYITRKYSLNDLLAKLNIKNQFNIYYDAILPASSYLSKPELVQQFNFDGKDKSTYNVRAKFNILHKGLFTGFKGSFTANLSAKTMLDISGDNIQERKTSDCLKHCYLPIEKPFEVSQGDVIELSYARYYPPKRTSPFRQGYSWSGSIIRNKKVVYAFAQKTC